MFVRKGTSLRNGLGLSCSHLSRSVPMVRDYSCYIVIRMLIFLSSRRHGRGDVFHPRSALPWTQTTKDARRGPCNWSQHPVHALLGASLRAHRLVHRTTTYATLRYVAPPFLALNMANECSNQLMLNCLHNCKDLYEIAVLLATCFLVNYVTADSKTNWAEGYIMITFYMIIVRLHLCWSWILMLISAIFLLFAVMDLHIVG